MGTLPHATAILCELVLYPVMFTGGPEGTGNKLNDVIAYSLYIYIYIVSQSNYR